MKLVFVLIYGCISATNGLDATGAYFTAVAPKVVFPNSEYKINIAVEEGGAPTRFSASLSTSAKSLAGQEVNINAGMSGVLAMELGDLSEDSYNLTIKSDTYGKKFEDSVMVFVKRNSRAIFIQTDKPMYKPGDTVKFRIVVLDRSLKPFSEIQTVDIKIYDPAQNVIKLLKAQKAKNGLFSSSFELSTEPNLGDWSIEATSGSKVEKQIFAVSTYVLPKFKVDVVLPPFVTVNSSKVRVEIKAFYTYGKAIKGDCTVTFSQKQAYYYQGNLNPVISRTLEIDGSVMVEFDAARDSKFDNILSSFYNELEFEVKASVKDRITGREQNGTSSIKMYKLPYKVEQIDAPESYQPGLPIIMKFKVTTQDNKPITEKSPNALTVNHGFAYNDEGSSLNAPIPKDGIVTFRFITPSNDMITVSSVEVIYKEFKQQFYLPQRMQSKSKTYIQIYRKNENSLERQTFEFELIATKEFRSFKYFVYAGGNIYKMEVVNLAESVTKHSFKIQIPKQVTGDGKIFVFALFGNNREIAAHSLKFSSTNQLSNKLQLSMSAEELEPGKKLKISMKTQANSVIAIRGVDQSVLLLREDKDINKQRIDSEMKKMEDENANLNRIWGGSGAFQVFDQAGLIILTNGFLEKAEYIRFRPIRFEKNFMLVRKGAQVDRAEAVLMEADMAPVAMMAKGSVNDMAMPAPPTPSIRVRTNFLESWLWEEFWLTQNNMTTSFERTVPDTLTSWVITGFSINSQLGIVDSGDPLVLKTFRPFFISLNLPYSVVKGEVLALQVLVHNYMSDDVQATITMSNKEDKFTFADKPDATVMKKVVTVPASDIAFVTFVIIPTKFGITMLKVNGTTEMAGDGLSQPLTVKPPGHQQRMNKAVLIDLRAHKQADYELTATFPEQRVEGADSLQISFIADLLGSTISNLDKLLQMPCGCGEQNMITFVPDIVILDYLTKTKKLTAEIKSKAIKFLESGYQRELTYRHYDGSYSAFGNSDPQGSTWLTAFVVRSFVSAKAYITIDDQVIRQSMQYLAQRQQENGSFQELGRVVHSDMTGGSSTGYALTAYTLLAFIESSLNAPEAFGKSYDTHIKKGLNYISEAASRGDLDLYAMVLIAYTLELGKHSTRDKYFELVKQKATTNGGMTHWEMQDGKNSKKMNGEPRTMEFQFERPVNVEMTAYALLTYLLRNEIEACVPIGKWLLAQRNAEGGFLSTQDTVVGLTALAGFSALSSGNTDIKIKAEYDGGEKNVKLNEENAIVLQEFVLPSTVRTVNLEATGKGTALAQLTWSYYVENENKQPSFTLTVEAEAAKTKLTLKICSKYTVGEQSNMVVLEVNLPSGFTFENEDLVSLKTVPRMKRYDLEDGDSKLSIYFEYLDAQKSCVTLKAQRIFSVGKQAPAYVLVYDYYDTTKRARTFYDAPKGEESCSVCMSESCKANCVEA